MKDKYIPYIVILIFLFVVGIILYWIDTVFTTSYFTIEPHENNIRYKRNYWFKEDIDKKVEWREVETGHYEWCAQNPNGEWVEIIFLNGDEGD